MTAKELVKSYYEAFNRKDWAAMLNHLHEDIRHEANQGDVRVGKEKFAEFLAHMDTCYDETLTDMILLDEPTNTRVAAEFVVNGTYKATDGDFLEATGQTYRLPAGAFLAITDGKISRITTYYNLPLWIKLVGREG